MKWLVRSFAALTLLVGACASRPVEIDVRSVTIVSEPLEEGRPAEVILRIDYSTTYNFAQHGTTLGFLVPCNDARDWTGRPTGDAYELAYPTPYDFDASRVSDQVFTARYSANSYQRFLWVTPANDTWSVSFQGNVDAHGLCFFVRGEGYYPNTRNSVEVRIDEKLRRSLTRP